MTQRDADLSRVVTEHRSDALGRLRQAIIDNTRGDLFWIGEILLNELRKETGFDGADGENVERK